MEDIHCWQTKFDPCVYSDRLLGKITELNNRAVHQVDITEVKKAIYYAKKYHGNQRRKSGEPYYSHPLEVAYMVADYLFKTDVIVASLLHDTVEDTELTSGMILDIFGHRIEVMVDRLTRDRPDGSKLSIEEILHNAYVKKDIEVLIIKIVDRIHNLQTKNFLNEEKQAKINKYTLKDFLPMLYELGHHKFADMIISLCIEEKEHPIFQDILSLEPTELNQVPYRFKGLPYYDL